MSEISKIINKFTIVQQIPLFSKLNWFDINFIVNKCSVFECKKGEIVYREADPPDAFYCLISGRLEAYTAGVHGQREVLEYLYRGQHFGIISLLTGDNHSVTVRAINDSLVLKINKDDFERMLAHVPRLSIELSQNVSRRLKRKELHQKTIFESTIICIHSPITESGSSTYAINLALSLKKETNRKVVLLNINSSTEEVLDVLNVARDLPSLDLKNITYENTKIVQEILSHEWGIDLLNIKYEPSDASRIDQVSLLLSFLSNDYHYIVVDLPNRIDDIILKTLSQSDFIHFIVFPQEESARLLNEIVGGLKLELKEAFREEKIKIIIRQFDADNVSFYKSLSENLRCEVYATLPNLESVQEAKAVNPGDIVVVISKPDCEYAKAIRRISRELGEVLVGLALGGGAALGLAHIGVLKVLEKEDIPVDVVVGSSIGALIAALWASGNTAVQIEEIASKFKNKLFSFRLIDFAFPISGLIRGRKIDGLLREIFGEKTFRNTNRKLKIISYDLISRRDVIIESGKLADAVRESIAIPGIFRPITRDGMLLIDGGVLNPVPTNILARMGIKKIIAVNTLHNPEDALESYNHLKRMIEKQRELKFLQSPFGYVGFRIREFWRKIFFPNIFDVIVNSFQAAEYVLAEESCRRADIAICPKLTGINWFELFNVETLVKNGEEETRRLLPEIKKLATE